MRYVRPPGLLAGFHADAPEPRVPELSHAGEQWAPRSFFVPWHAHDRWEFYLQISGESAWDGPDRTYTLAPGAFFAVPPGVVHTMHERPEARHHFYFAAIDVPAVLARAPALAALWRREAIVSVPRGEALLAPFRQLIREVSLNLAHRELGVRLALETLTLEATRLLESAPEGPSLALSHPAVRRAQELLEHHPEEPWRLADLARRVGLSPNHLVEQFTREVGLPPRRFLLETRVRRAQEMLARSDAPVTAIALELGFSSSQHFAATFKRLTGQTAQQHRREAAGLRKGGAVAPESGQ